MTVRSVGVVFVAALILSIQIISVTRRSVLASSQTVLLSDDLSVPPINTSNWIAGSLFSGYTNKALSMSIAGGSLNIGPLLSDESGSNYNGLVSKAGFQFTNAFAYVEVIQAPSASTKAEAMLTIGYSSNDFYRIYVEGGSLIVEQNIGGTQTQLYSAVYNATNDKFLEIRDDTSTGKVWFETAPDSGGGVPGTWTTEYSETWNTSAIPLSYVQLEIEAGTWEPESNPGTVKFANFFAALSASGSNGNGPPVSTPTPTPARTPSASPTPTPTPKTTPTPEPSPSPTPEPSPKPTPTPSPSPTPEPSPKPTPTPSPSPTLAPSPTPTPVPSPTTTPTPSATASMVSSYNVTATGAVILWTTSTAGTSEVQYGTTTSYGSSTPLDPIVSTDHTLPLFGLQSGTTYDYRTVTTTSSGQAITSGNMTFTTLSQAPAGQPALPEVEVNTAMPTVSGSVINVSAGANLQTVFNSVQPGDTIVLQAGATYNAPAGGLVMPPTSNPNNQWIIVTTSDVTNLPADGVRVGPSNSAAMPSILSTDTGAAVMTQTGAGASSVAYWRFVGIEFSVTSTALTNANATDASANTGLVRFGDPDETNSSNVPHNLVLDRCYIHGNPTMNTIRGVNLNSTYSAVISCYLSDFHGVGWESQAICGWNGAGPYKINNNYLEGASENVMFGGSDPAIQNLIPSDIEIRLNLFSKPLSWQQTSPTYAGYHWSVKNIFELKNSQRTLVMGNTFQNCWVDAQIGYAISIKSSNEDGTAPWSQTKDATFAANTVENAAIGIQVAARDNTETIQVTTRVSVIDNLFEDINSAASGGAGTMVRIIGQNAPPGYASSGPTYVTVDHNTGFVSSNNDGMMLEFSDNTPGFVFTDNLFDFNNYACLGAGTADGDQTLQTYAPGVVFTDNGIVGNPAGAADFVDFPGNFFPASWTVVQFVNYNDGQGGDYHLQSTSPYITAGIGGTALGANIDHLNIASGTGT
jgi:hypothetical protein